MADTAGEAGKKGTSETPRGRGRPSISEESAIVRTVRITPTAHFAARRNALLLGKTVGQYVSELLLDAPAPPDVSPPARGEVWVRSKSGNAGEGVDRGPCADHATAAGSRRLTRAEDAGPGGFERIVVGGQRVHDEAAGISAVVRGDPAGRATAEELRAWVPPPAPGVVPARMTDVGGPEDGVPVPRDREGVSRGAPGGMAARAWRGGDDGVQRLGGLPT